MNPHQVTQDFEDLLCEYTGAKFAITTTSCTQALLMSCAWFKRQGWDRSVSMPKYSYVGVPASILSAGFEPFFTDIEWSGEYQIEPLPVLDAARRFTSGMYRTGFLQCVSFHWSKILGLSQGGAILLDDRTAYEWLLKARFDGRSAGINPVDDIIQYPSWHAYLSPEISAQGIMKLSLLPKQNADLPLSDYPDLSKIEAFKGGEIFRH